MRVTIWDLDYYYAKKKRNKFNADAMRVSSYHKQMGDRINFVTTEYDIRRPYDIYYIFKENPKLPNPPADFLLNPHVRWLGSANRFRQWKMPNVMMAVRPDYLLYPEKETVEEKSEQLRLFNNKAELLPIIQDYSNTFRGRKRVLLTDKNIWYSSKKDLIQALKILQDIEKLTFSEPIWLQKIINDEDIKKEFFKLKLTPGAKIHWQTVDIKDYDRAFKFLMEVKAQWPNVAIGPLPLRVNFLPQWTDKDKALNDFKLIKTIIIQMKKEGLQAQILPMKQRSETPYFFLFSRISDWTCGKRASLSWLEFLMGEYKMYDKLNKPHLWNELFRDLLRQTYTDKEFLLLRKKDNYYDFNEVPWSLLDDTFEIGL